MRKVFTVIILVMGCITTMAQEKLINIQDVSSIVNTIKDNKIIGLGEGTHGTKEFNQIRSEITKKLIQNHQFNKVIFETAYGDMYYMNQVINSEDNIREAMKKYLLRMWQSDEIEELFTWIRTYNKTHKRGIEVSGFDHNFLANSARILVTELKNLEGVDIIVDSLYKTAETQDYYWIKSNDTTYSLDHKSFMNNGLKGYQLVEKLNNFILNKNIVVKDEVKKALYNLKSGFTVIYEASKGNYDDPRDLLMANFVEFIANENKENKIILWGHDAHLAFGSLMIEDPMGRVLKQKYKNEYYSLGTLTANGTYSVMNDHIDTKINNYKIISLPLNPEDSWNKYFSELNVPFFFIDLRNSSLEFIKNKKLKVRVLGYSAVTEEEVNLYYTSKPIELNQFFDGVVFLKDTEGTKHFE